MLQDARVYESEKVKKDQTAKYKERLVSLLSELKEQGKITLEQYRDLYPTSDMVLWLYDSEDPQGAAPHCGLH